MKTELSTTITKRYEALAEGTNWNITYYLKKEDIPTVFKLKGSLHTLWSRYPIPIPFLGFWEQSLRALARLGNIRACSMTVLTSH